MAAPAVNAQVGNPVAVAVDSVGNVYIADGSSRVRKLFLSGIITTIAGSGTTGYSGDGGSAVECHAERTFGPGGQCRRQYLGGRYPQQRGAPAAVHRRRYHGQRGDQWRQQSERPGVARRSGRDLRQRTRSGAARQFQPDANGRVPTTVAGTSVYFNGVAAPVLYASSNQVAAIVPFGIGNSLAQMYVQNQNVTSAAFNLSVASQIPAVFTLNGSGTGQAAAINNKDGSINGAASPAKVGDYVQLYITGVGQTNPSGTDGVINAAPLPVPVADVKVTIGGKTATVNFAGGAPGSVAGVIQVNAQIPSGITAGGAVPVVVQVGTSNSQPGVTIAVTN